MNVSLHQMSIKEAIDAPRFHSQWMPDIIDYEKNSLSKKVLTNLKQMGHDLNQRGSIGEANGTGDREMADRVRTGELKALAAALTT